jgi:putative peptidoglycan lipid II flippase
VVSFAMVLAVAVSALLALAAGPIIHLYTAFNRGSSGADETAVAATLLRLFAPQVAFYSAITISTALLLARRRFANPKFSPIANNLVVIGVLIAVPHVVHHADQLALVRHNHGALLFLGLGTTAGVAVQAFIQVPGYQGLRAVWDPRHPVVRTIIRLSTWTFGVVVANQIALYVALALANQHAGDVSAYLAAFVFFLLPHGVIAVSVMDTILPDLASRWTHDDRRGFAQRTAQGLTTVTAVMVPAAVGYVLLARPIVGLALEHGAARADAASTVAGTLAAFAVGLPGFSAYLLLMRSFQAAQDTRSMFLLYVVENAINILLALVLHPSLGVQGLALSFAAAYTVTAVLAWQRLRLLVGGLDARRVVRTIVRVCTASALMAAAVAIVSLPFGGNGNFAEVARVGAGVTVGVTVYLLVTRAMHVDELTALVALRRRRTN